MQRTWFAAFLLGAAWACAPAIAQPGGSTFQQGDKVEVKVGFDWKPGTVIGVNRLGWIEVELDEGESGLGLPSEFPRPRMPRAFRPEDVRARPVENLVATADTSAASEREWNDRSGRFSVDARYEGLKGTHVVLVKSDGKRIEVPLEKLSDEDIAYVREIEEPTENPFEQSVVSIAPTRAAPTGQGNWRNVKLVRPRLFEKWSFAPATGEGMQLLELSKAKDAEIRLKDMPDSERFFENVLGIYVSSDGSRVAVCREQGAVSQESKLYLELVDFRAGESAGLTALPAETAMLDVQADAGLVMYRSDKFHFGAKSQLTIARLDDSKLTPIKQWEPYRQETWEPKRDVVQGWFLSADRAMTINNHGKALTVWDVNSAKALFNVPVSNEIGLEMALSPDRRLLAVIMQGGIAIIDLTAGHHVATIETEGRDYSRVEFRADNRQLAGLGDSGVTVWDLTTGAELREFVHTALDNNSELAWAGEFLLAQNRYLFEVERRILLWEYQGAPGREMTARLHAGRLWAVTRMEQDQPAVLISAAMPHASAIREAKRLPSADELLVVKPGDPVAIEIDIDPGIDLAEEMRKLLDDEAKAAGVSDDDGSDVVVLKPGDVREDFVRKKLAAALEDAGLRVVEESGLVVKAVCKPQPQQTIRINVDGRFPVRTRDIVERTITPHASYLEMTSKGKVLWKRGFVARPFMTIWTKPGESLDEALERLTEPNVALFTQTKFSAHVARPGKATENGAYGVSQFTTHGVVDGKSSRGGRVAFD